jgi:hypothetical protein
MAFQEIIDDFNNGELDIQKYFNDYNTFFNVLKKRGLMSQIDVKGSGSEEWQNEYLIWLYENDREKFYKDVVMLLDNDLEMDESGKIYYVTNDRGELSRLFCSNRNDIDQSTIEQILSGDGDIWEPYWDTTDDVYRDVIEELTPENDKRLQEYIVDSLKDNQIEIETEELELIASEQGHPEYALVTPENVKRIIDDRETMEYLFVNGLEDLKSELYSIHSSSYNSAYEDEVYEDIWDEIGEYFYGKGEWISRPHRYKKDTNVEFFKIPVGGNFDTVILDYLHNNKGYGNSGTLEYHGSYVGILSDSTDCLSVRVPDYPDSRLVDKNINMYFQDSI